MRTIVADDECLARDKLRLMLSSEPGVHIVAECQNGIQTLNAVASHNPDLLLLDISMPDLNGFQVLEKLPSSTGPRVIFTTAFDHHAVRAFEAHALDYLLKPFDKDRLHNAIERARTDLLKTTDKETTQRILSYISGNGRKPGKTDRRFIIKTGGRIVFLHFDEIQWVEAAANYIRINTAKQTYLLREAIGRAAQRLDSEQFVRIHRSVIVNVQQIKELQPVNSGEYIVVLKDGKELSCSRGYRAGLQRIVESAL